MRTWAGGKEGAGPNGKRGSTRRPHFPLFVVRHFAFSAWCRGKEALKAGGQVLTCDICGEYDSAEDVLLGVHRQQQMCDHNPVKGIAGEFEVVVGKFL